MKAKIPYLYCECGVSLVHLKDMVSCTNNQCQFFGKEFIAPVFELRPKLEPKKTRNKP